MNHPTYLCLFLTKHNLNLVQLCTKATVLTVDNRNHSGGTRHELHLPLLQRDHYTYLLIPGHLAACFVFPRFSPSLPPLETRRGGFTLTGFVVVLLSLPLPCPLMGFSSFPSFLLSSAHLSPGATSG